MKKGTKKLLVVGLILAMLLLIWLGVLWGKNTHIDNGASSGDVNNSGELSVQENEAKVKSGNNSSEEIVYKDIQGTKKVGVLEFSNIRIGDMGRNRCVFEADVKNTSDEYLKATNIGITVIDANGEEQEVFGGIVGELGGRELNKFKTYALTNIMDAADVKLEIIE